MKNALKNNSPLKNDIPVDFHTFRKGASVLRALNHQIRQNMLRLIHNNREMTVTQIYTEMNLEQSVASQQLAILRKAGLVDAERDGKFVIYSVNHARLDQVHQIAYSLLGKYRL